MTTDIETIASQFYPDLSNAPSLLAAVDIDDMVQLFSGTIDSPLPKWPSAQVRRQYTGAAGTELMRRTCHFVDQLDADGAFSPRWRGLDFGAGWGRIASCLLRKGDPGQLDLCDAGPGAIAQLYAGGFQNRRWLLPAMPQAGSAPLGAYDFVYAFSVFSHLSEPAFRAGINHLFAALKAGGRLYFKVRHSEFLEPVRGILKLAEVPTLNTDGVWHVSYPANRCMAKP